LPRKQPHERSCTAERNEIRSNNAASIAFRAISGHASVSLACCVWRLPRYRWTSKKEETERPRFGRGINLASVARATARATVIWPIKIPSESRTSVAGAVMARDSGADCIQTRGPSGANARLPVNGSNFRTPRLLGKVLESTDSYRSLQSLSRRDVLEPAVGE